jgi:hypothetical protein
MVEVHNAYTLYEINEKGKKLDRKLVMLSRPQDWARPGRWHYHQCEIKFEVDGVIYINHCHLWQEIERKPVEAFQAIAGYLFRPLYPGMLPELAGRSHLAEEDIWEDSWGKKPPTCRELYSDEDFDDDDPVVLYDPISGPIRDSQLREICEQVVETQAISTWGVLTEDADMLRRIFPNGKVPIASGIPFQPNQNAPDCYLVDGSLLSEEKLVALVNLLHESFSSLLTEISAAAYIQEGGLPLRTSWFEKTIVYTTVMTSSYLGGIPHYWRNETSGRLENTIEKYFLCRERIEQNRPDFTDSDVALLRGYFFHWASAPNFSVHNDLSELIKQIRSIHSIEDIDQVLGNLTELGLDPL